MPLILGETLLLTQVEGIQTLPSLTGPRTLSRQIVEHGKQCLLELLRLRRLAVCVVIRWIVVRTCHIAYTAVAGWFTQSVFPAALNTMRAPESRCSVLFAGLTLETMLLTSWRTTQPSIARKRLRRLRKKRKCKFSLCITQTLWWVRRCMRCSSRMTVSSSVFAVSELFSMMQSTNAWFARTSRLARFVSKLSTMTSMNS